MDKIEFIEPAICVQKSTWKEWCKACNKNHIVMLKPCPDCGVYHTPQPKSEKVYNSCNATYICDGCEAYLDHYTI